MTKTMTFSMLIGVLLAVRPVLGGETPGGPDDEQRIRAAVRSYVEAFNRADADAIADHWAEDARYTASTGERFTGREAIRAAHESYFAETPGIRIEILDPRIRLIGSDTAIEEGKVRVLRPGEAPEETTYLAVHVKINEKWQLDTVREDTFTTVPSHHGWLKELEWMVGEWVDQDENVTVRTKCSWTKNRNYLTRSFSVSVQDRIDLEGTQVIGWDPAARQIRSWVFDSDGGFGEGRWRQEGNRWIVTTNAVLPDGKKASAVNIITHVDENTFTWQSVDRVVDGELLPNIEAFRVVRVNEK